MSSGEQDSVLSRRDFLRVALAAAGAGFVLGKRMPGGEGVVKIGMGSPDRATEDQIEIYGEETPFNQEQLDELKESINKEAAQTDKDTFYVTFGATKTAMETFKSKEGKEKGSLQSYIKVLKMRMNEILSPLGLRMDVRRLIIMEDNVQFPRSHMADYSENGFRDSDGTWVFEDTPQNWMTDLHELGHSTIRLPDGYGVDYAGPDDYKLFEGIPKHWRAYYSWYRQDYKFDLMTRLPQSAGGSLNMGRYFAADLLRRKHLGVLHDLAWVSKHRGMNPEWPAEFPDIVDLNFIRWDGQVIEIEKVEIYGTERDWSKESGYNKIMIEEPVYVGDGKGLASKNLFRLKEGKFIDPANATLLVKTLGKDGQWYWRWMDGRDFIIPALEMPEQSRVQMRIPVNNFTPFSDEKRMNEIVYA